MANVYSVIKVNKEDIEDINVLEVNKTMEQAIHTIYRDLKADVSQEQAEAEIKQALDEDGYVLNSEITYSDDDEFSRERTVYLYFIRKSELF